MKVIDAHHHAWEYDPVKHSWISDEMSVIKKDFLADDLEAVFSKNGIEGSVLVQADQSEKETDFLLTLADENEFIKGVVGWVNLRDESVEQRLAHYRHFDKLKGFRHVVQSEPDAEFMLLPEFQRGISALHHFGFTYDILIFPNQLPAAIELTKNFSHQKFVLDHIAKPYVKDKKISEWTHHINELAKQENVNCKVSGIITEADWDKWDYDELVPYLDVIFEAFGVDRIMFGSDYPVCLLAGTYDTVKGIVNRYIDQFSEQDQQKIFRDNAVTFYNL